MTRLATIIYITFMTWVAMGLGIAPAFSQQVTCATRSVGDSSNACASTSFVQNQFATNLTFPVTVSNGVSGGIPCFTSTATLSASTLLVANSFMVGGGAGTCPSTITNAAATAALVPFVGDSGSGGTQGVVPAPAAGDKSAGKLLNANGSWVPYQVNVFEYMSPTQIADVVAGTFAQDVSTPINNAIAACPSYGCEVLFPPGGYGVASGITVGNGSAGGNSTMMGIKLKGLGQHVSSSFFGDKTISTARIKYTGGLTGGNLLKMSGPINGWGIEDLTFDCNLLCGTVVYLQSMAYGDMKNVSMVNGNAAQLATQTLGISNTEGNSFSNLLIVVPDVAFARGISLDGNVDHATDTDLNSFNNTKILLPMTSTTTYGLYLKNCDTNTFVSTNVFGGGANSAPILFDYTGNNQWPTGNMFLGLDPGGLSTTKFANSGSPNQSGGARPNKIYGLSGANLAGAGQELPNLLNLTAPIEQIAPWVSLKGQNATIAPTTMWTAYNEGDYRISYYLATTTAGTAGTVSATFQWTDNGQNQTLTTTNLNLNAKGYLQGSIVVHSIPTGFLYWTTVGGVTGSPQYELMIHIEQLT